MVEIEEIEKLEFKWGSKKRVGGKNKDIRFYESFTYDGLEYALYDDVYLYTDAENLPHIGKLIKIWEDADKSKKVMVLWYFQAFEISRYLVVELAHPNEIFLARGKGPGLANINPLEVIAGKCNVICISKDSRNPQPSEEELQMADYVFYRTFDVQQCIISDKIDDQIAGIDAKFIFNRVGSLEPNSVHTPGVDNKHASENAKETTERMTLRTSSSENRHPEDYKQEEVADGVAEKLPANDRQDNATFNKTASSLKVEEKSDLKVPSVNPVVSPREKPVSGAGIESGQPTKTDDRQGSTSCENIGLSHNIIDEKMDRVGNSFVSQVKVEEKLKFTEDLGESNERPHKKAKVDSSVSVSDDKNKIHVLKPNRDSDANTSKPIVPNFTASEDKSRHAIDPLGTAKESSKKLNVDEDVAKPTGGKSQKKPPVWNPNDGIKTSNKMIEVTRRPYSDKSNWFAELPWEETMREAYEHGTLVLFQNLDPAYTSEDVESIVWSAFREICTAKMLHQTAYSSPHSGQAFAIFRTSEMAERVVRELDEKCLLLSNQRPLVARMPTVCFPKKQATFPGHLLLDKLKSQREMKEAVSTSHASQANTLQYEMAIEWRLLVKRSDLAWRKLYRQQREEVKKLKDKFKSK